MLDESICLLDFTSWLFLDSASEDDDDDEEPVDEGSLISTPNPKRRRLNSSGSFPGLDYESSPGFFKQVDFNWLVYFQMINTTVKY